MNIILASQSPRRRELLQHLFPEFSVFPADLEEVVPPEIPTESAAQYLAQQKARAVAADFPEALVIGADTIVVANGEILGKPADENDARRMLRMLSGIRHDVYTGVSVVHNGTVSSFTSKTGVEFYPLSGEEIDAYLATGEPFDKAGAYGVQGRGSLFVKAIHGDYFNVVGLPVAELGRHLRRLQII